MSGSDKKKLTWDDRMNESYIRICVQEVRAGNRPTTHLNKKGWANLQEKCKLILKKDLDSKQLKNKWDNLKKDWQLWRRLINRETGIGWNPIKKTIEASDEWWEAKLKEMPGAIKFRDKGLLLPDEMDVLFGDIVAVGKEAWAPASGILPAMGPEVNELESSDDNEESSKSTPQNDISMDASSKGKAKRLISAGSSQMKKKQSKGQNVQTTFDRLSGVVESVNKRMDSGINSCIALMKSLNIEDDEFFYDCLYMLTENKDARNMLLGLDDPKMQLGYLRRMVAGKK